jgi:hypothetical protein
MFPAAMPIMHPSYFHTTTTHAQALSLSLSISISAQILPSLVFQVAGGAVPASTRSRTVSTRAAIDLARRDGRSPLLSPTLLARLMPPSTSAPAMCSTLTDFTTPGRGTFVLHLCSEALAMVGSSQLPSR